MKRLTLVRHGDAEWKDAKLPDFERPLNRRGMKEADSIARRMLELDWVPDLLIASTAERARTTAEIISKTLSPKRTQFEEKLYLAPVEDILRVARATGPLVSHLMLVGHNPGLSEVVKGFTRKEDASELSTACACSLVFKIESWTELAPDRVLEAAQESPSMLAKLWA